MKIVKSYLFSLLLVSLIYSCSKSDNNSAPNGPATEYKLKLKGLVKACNSSNLTNGDIIIVSNQGYLCMHISNGYFDTTLQSRNKFDSVFLWAIDLNSLTVSDTLKIQVSGNSIDFGQISACSRNVDEYIKCKIDNDTFVYVPALYDTLQAGGWDTLATPTTYFYRSSERLTNSKFYRMQFAGMSTGTFGVNWNCTFQIGRYYSFNMPNSGTVTYTSYGSKGNFIKGTLNIPFIDNTDSLNHLLTGSFQVRRDY
jgi:hypothetical protein